MGDGPLMKEIKELSKELKIEERVICDGVLPAGEAVLNFLDTIDLYIQFSRTEGMPRAMLEAMARGCPVVASRVGGIPELISKDFLVTPGNVNDLVQKITKLLNDIECIKKVIVENNNTAKHFVYSNLNKKRSDFFSEIVKLYQADKINLV